MEDLLPAKASEVGCLLSHDFRFGFLYNPTVSKQKDCSPSVVDLYIYISIIYCIYIYIYFFLLNLRIVAFFLLNVSKSLFTEKDSERPMVYWRG